MFPAASHTLSMTVWSPEALNEYSTSGPNRSVRFPSTMKDHVWFTTPWLSNTRAEKPSGVFGCTVSLAIILTQGGTKSS